VLVIRIHLNTRQASATKEGTTVVIITTDSCYTVRYDYTRQAGTVSERSSADGRYAVGDNYTRQAGAALKCTAEGQTTQNVQGTFDVRYIVAYGDARQAGTVLERTSTDSCYTVGYDYTC
jgi:hypothetical protein